MTFYALIRGFHQSNNYTSCLFQTGRELFDEGDKMEIMDMYAPCYCVTKAISQWQDKSGLMTQDPTISW